ncbi:response regulator transcription factor [Rhodoblastus sp.]|uniref:response regulator transcription factor n=1 Tax=Rhodoblastus sp. TaxID=1962975 RepID=UPI003F984696
MIDDDTVIRNSLGVLLALEGYLVQTYASARSFLDTIEQTGAGCILTDFKMPEIDGLDLLARLNERGVFMPVIVMSAFPDAGLEITAMKRGAVDYFEKPFDPEILLAAIHTVLTRSHSQIS